jgi:hypothetical protein
MRMTKRVRRPAANEKLRSISGNAHLSRKRQMEPLHAGNAEEAAQVCLVRSGEPASIQTELPGRILLFPFSVENVAFY